MKKLIFAIIVTISGISQAAAQPHFSSMGEAWKWVSDNIAYQDSAVEDWKTPEQTIKDGCGTCYDYSVLLASFFHDMGIDCLVVLETDHAIIKVNGVYIEPQAYGVTYDHVEVVDAMPYDDAIFLAKNF